MHADLTVKKSSRAKGCACGCLCLVLITSFLIAALCWYCMQLVDDTLDSLPLTLELPELASEDLESLLKKKEELDNGLIQELKLSPTNASALISYWINKNSTERKGTGCLFQEDGEQLSILCSVTLFQLYSLLEDLIIGQQSMYFPLSDYYINFQIENFSTETLPQETMFLYGIEGYDVKSPRKQNIMLLILGILIGTTKEKLESYVNHPSLYYEIIKERLSFEDGYVILK